MSIYIYKYSIRNKLLIFKGVLWEVYIKLYVRKMLYIVLFRMKFNVLKICIFCYYKDIMLEWLCLDFEW